MSLAEARRALRDNDWRALAAFLQDAEIAAVMTPGVSFAGGSVSVAEDCEVARRGGRKEEREALGWTMARAAGVMDGAVELNCLWHGGEIATVSCIAGLPNVATLSCGSGGLAVAPTLPALRALTVPEDAQPAAALAELHGLRVLTLREGEGASDDRQAAVEDRRAALLDAAVGLPLEELSLSGCTDADLARVARIRTLRVLCIDGWGFTTLEPLRGHPALRSLKISLYDVDADALGTIPTLEVVQIRGVRSLAWVAGTPALRILCVSTKSDLGPLAGAVALEELRVGGTVADLTPLARLPRLSVLEVRAERGAAALGTLTALHEARLELGHADLSTVEALGALPALSKLTLRASASWRREGTLAHLPVESLASAAACRAFAQVVRAARLPRTLPVVEALSKEETAALRGLNTAFKAAKTSRDALPAIRATC